MNYPCNLIKDLLPLYADDACSKESKEIVEQHLSECPDCQNYYDKLSNEDTLSLTPDNPEHERQKAESFRTVRKKLKIRQILIAIISIAVLIAVILSTLVILGKYENTVTYEDNISVNMVDGSLVGRLSGARHHSMRAKRIDITANGEETSYLFFYFRTTKLDELITRKDTYTECVLCYADKGADTIDYVFYYTGDNTGIESMSYDELQNIIEDSVLLWSK